MYDSILANFAMHISLDAAETEHVLSVLQHKTVKKNTVLLHTGEICRWMWFVNKGCLHIYHTDNEAVEHNVSFTPENWWAADISSFSGQSPAFYSISAPEDTEAFYISYDALEQLYKAVPKFERFFRILVQNGFNLYQRRITSSLSKTAEERYINFKKQYPTLEQRIAQKQIASYLGITAVFLSMIRKKMMKG